MVFYFPKFFMTTTKKIRWTGELLPRLRSFLLYNLIPFRQLNLSGAHTGFTNDRCVFVAKSKIWRDQVSTQKILVQKSIEKARWIIFYIPNTWLLAFDPKVIFDNSWQNKRWDEFMLNIQTKFGCWLSVEELKHLKPLQYGLTSQLTLA